MSKKTQGRVPLQPGAYMSAKDRGIWLLEQDGNAMYWRMPGGLRIVPMAMHSTMASVVEPHLPFRRMAPIRRKES